MKTLSFRSLVLARARRVPKGVPPIPMTAMAQLLGISRPFLYALMAGERSARASSIASIAKGLRVSQEKVRRSIAAS